MSSTASSNYDPIQAHGNIPWQCWDLPGFKDCHTEAGHKTYRYLESEGLVPGTELWNEQYAKFLRQNVWDCQIFHACTPEALKILPQGSPGGSVLPKILLAGVGVLGLIWLFKRGQGR